MWYKKIQPLYSFHGCQILNWFLNQSVGMPLAVLKPAISDQQKNSNKSYFVMGFISEVSWLLLGVNMSFQMDRFKYTYKITFHYSTPP